MLGICQSEFMSMPGNVSQLLENLRINERPLNAMRDQYFQIQPTNNSICIESGQTTIRPWEEGK